MRTINESLQVSATDLSAFLGCRQRTALDLAVAVGRRSKPDWLDPALLVLQKRGFEHERRFVERLSAEVGVIVNLGDHQGDAALRGTVAAMRRGADVVYQGLLEHDGWGGRPDFLRRVENPSALGGWSYEVLDAKLANRTKAATILQLSLYSELLREVQGIKPAFFHVVIPRPPEQEIETYRVDDYSAYFRSVRGDLEKFVQGDVDELLSSHYPEPVEQCEICHWWPICDRRRRSDDHLAFVAGISRLQIGELRANGVRTLEDLGSMQLPLPFTPSRGASDSFVRVREQARLQLEARQDGTLRYELLPTESDRGFARLPPPSPGDIFLDLEGDRFAREGGREYLFGTTVIAEDGSLKNQALWAFSDAEEKAAFEEVVDAFMHAWERDPGMHVYHYAPYEPSAFKRLMGRYGTREDEVDRLLRAERFVDLYAVARQSVRASVERYSIKDLEPFYGFIRSVDLEDARTNLRLIETALELGDGEAINEEVRTAVEGYNRDDCISTYRLRQWLEQRRSELVATGVTIPRPTPKDSSPSEKVDDRSKRARRQKEALLADVPADEGDRNETQQALWLLAQLLEWHRREDKAPWWEFYRLRDLTAEELFGEKSALAGLTHVERVGGTARSPIDRYRYPVQEADVRRKDDLRFPDGEKFGTVDAIDRLERTVDVKKVGTHADAHPTAVFAHTYVPSDTLADALSRIAEDVVENGLDATAFQAARELLLTRRPRLRSGRFAQERDESPVRFAIRVGTELDQSVLAIQGPPGAGKTYTGARMITELVRQGKKVGVTAVSHRAIRNLLDEAEKAASHEQTAIRVIHKVSDKSEDPDRVMEVTDNKVALSRLHANEVDVVGGTVWLWASAPATDAVDVLFVDEAGQMSLANVLAASQAANSVVLLGDPRQLEQPQQGTHPDGADASALDHILGERRTIPPEQGIFLPETWRLAPSICDFTSEVFYESRLKSHEGLESQRLEDTGILDGSGLWLAPTQHTGNQNSSPEEVDVVLAIVSSLLRSEGHWIDAYNVRNAMTADDVLVVAPYNSQVSLLQDRLAPLGVRVGTVDRFQGQEAPVVIYSMATSSPEDAPRGMEFLYSLSRLNVATSRARCACILVASPPLFEPECRSPRQMRLASALCRFVELAQIVDASVDRIEQ